MDILKIQDLQELINKEGLVVSIYMPTFRSGVDIRQNGIKFKQLLREVEAKLYFCYLYKFTVFKSLSLESFYFLTN